MSFIDRNQLESIYREGRFKKNPTICIVDMGAMMGMPPEAVIARMPQGMDEPRALGACWAGDIEHILKIAESEGDTIRVNANILVLKDTFDALVGMRETWEEGQARLDRHAGSKVVSFPDLSC